MVVRRLIDGKYIAAQQMMMRVAIVTVSIALGFLLSTLFQEAWNKYIKRLKLAGEAEEVALQGLGKSV